MKLFSSAPATEETQVVVVGQLTYSTYADDIERLLAKSEKYFEEFRSLENILACIKNGMFQAWLARDKDGPFLCMITELVEFPNKRILHLLQISGTKSIGFSNYADVMESWAIQMGCTHIETECRDGFVPLLAKEGFEKRVVVMTKSLTDRRIH